jgi:ABC-type Fe3+/spermidine/putrescine transport system ATPase subunit
VSGDSALRCVGLRVEFPGATALDGLELSVARGEVVCLLGASGSGKSTLLNAIAGLVRPSAGEIWLGGRLVAGAGRSLPPEDRDIGLVFQDFALWPHLSALDTVAYPLRRAGSSRGAARRQAQDLLDQLGIGAFAGRRPAELSGGQQQRVGLARALARDPQLFLLDEPTAHLDTHLRTAFQDSVRQRRASTGAGALYATHDAGEALALADRVALIVSGRIIQVATPEIVYSEPVDPAAALLTGPGSLLAADVAACPDGRLSVDLGAGPTELLGGGITDPRARRRLLLVRPEWAHLDGPFRSRVTARAFRGPHTDYRVATPGGELAMRVNGAPPIQVGDDLRWGLRRAWVVRDEPGSAPTGGAGSAEGGDGPRMLDPVIDEVEV